METLNGGSSSQNDCYKYHSDGSAVYFRISEAGEWLVGLKGQKGGDGISICKTKDAKGLTWMILGYFC
jgi:hypothetical protein